MKSSWLGALAALVVSTFSLPSWAEVTKSWPASGKWDVFQAERDGVQTCSLQMNQFGRKSDWMVNFTGLRNGMLFMLGDADGSTKGIDRIVIKFDDNRVDTGPKIAQSTLGNGAPVVATAVNLHAPGYEVDFLAIFADAKKIIVATNTKTYDVPTDGASTAMAYFAECMAEIER